MKIKFDNESEVGPLIGIENIEIKSESIDGNNCGHDMFYWRVAVNRVINSRLRIIDISAACDTCDDYVASAYEVVCSAQIIH